MIRVLKWVLGSLLLLGATQVSAKCIQAGGTEANCEIAPVVWTAGWLQNKHTYRYESLDSAINGFGSYLRSTCEKCKSGILWNPLPGKHPDFYTHADTYLPRSNTNWLVMIWGVEYDNSGKLINYYQSGNLDGSIEQEPRCSGRSAELQEGVDGRRRWYCMPSKAPLSQVDQIIDSASGLDTTTEGCTVGCNPVNLVTGTKYDEKIDYQNYSPYPIVWKRSYNSRTERWTFNYTQSLNFAPDGGTNHVTLSRPDGSILVLNTPVLSTTSAPSVWNLAMGANKSWRGKLVDIRNAQGELTGWDYTNLNDETEHYNAQGTLQYIQSIKGERITLNYTNNQLTSIEDDFGRSLTINYTTHSLEGSFVHEDPSVPYNQPVQNLSKPFQYLPTFEDGQKRSQIQSVSDGSQTVAYTHVNTKGVGKVFFTHIKTVTYPDNSVLTYGYDTNGRLSTITDEANDLYATYTYDAYNRVTKSVHGNNQNPITYTYANSYTIVKDGNNNQAQFNITDATSKKINKNSGSNVPCTKCAGSKAKTISYNEFGDPLSVVDFENSTTQYTYDTNRGLPLTKTDAATTALQRTVSYTWHPNFRKPLTITEPTHVNGVAHTRTTTFVYNNFGDPVSMTISTSSGEPSRTWSYTYTSDLWLDTQTEPNGLVTKFTYDLQGNVLSKTLAFGTPQAQTVEIGGYNSKGLPTWSKDPNGMVTRSIWNNRDQIEVVETGTPSGSDIWGAGNWQTQTFEYNAWGALKTITDAVGKSQEYNYDTAHRVTSVVEKNSAGVQHAKVVYTYDLASNITKEELFDASNTSVLSHTQTFDTVNRIKTMVDANAKSTSFDYTNEDALKKITTPLANQTQYGFDLLQRPTLITDALNNKFSTTYDTQNNIQSAKDALNHTTTYAYNGFGDLVSITSPDRGNWSFEYNSAGQRTQTVDPRNVVSTTTYDILSRPTQIVFNGTAAVGSGLNKTTHTHTYVYDNCAKGKGRLCSYTDSTGTTTFTYNAWGDILTHTWSGKSGTVVANAVLRTQYTYLPNGLLDTMTYPSGKVLNIGYNAGFPSSLTFNNQLLLGNAQWTAWGEVKQWSWGSAGITGPPKNVVFAYDKNAQPLSITDTDTKTYTLDNDQRITHITDALNPSVNQTYTYSKVNQVIQNSFGSSPHVYTYDANGNLATLRNNTDGSNYTTASTSNRLISETPVVGSVLATPIAWTYDAMGSVINDGSGSYTYDVTGNMSHSERGAYVSDYGYNTQNQRVFKTTENGVEIYAYDAEGRRIGSYRVDASKPNGIAVQDELMYWDNWRVVGIARTTQNTVLHPVLSDHLGTPRKILTPTGSVVWSWDGKDAFGLQSPNENVSSSTFVFDARFPGQWFDKETGLFHNGFRYYNANVGRYTQSDPLGLEAGWNTYAYVAGNPVSAVDYLGLDMLDIHMKVSRGISWVDERIVDGLAAANARSLPQNVVDFTAGWGDGASMGIAKKVRSINGTNGEVNCFSSNYNIGSFAGGVNGVIAIPLGSFRSFNAGIIWFAKRGRINLYHYTTHTAAENIAKEGFILSEGIQLSGKGVYATPFSAKVAKNLGAKNNEGRVLIDKSSKMIPTVSPGNIKTIPTNLKK